MILLFLTANLYSIDKSIVGVLADPIRQDLSINDMQMGLILGLAYTLLSGVFGLGLGYLVDTKVRRNILVICVLLWSLSTIAGGLAPNYLSFSISRAFVGLGEAGLAPAAISLIADLFPPSRRGRAISGYLIGATLGSALAAVIPGWFIRNHIHLDLPVLGALASWRTSFVYCGAGGLALGALLAILPEPCRQGMPAGAGRSSKFADKIVRLSQSWRILVPLYSGFCLHYVVFIGFVSWTAVLLTRTFHLSIAQFANRMGLMLLLAGGAGYVIGGVIADLPMAKRRGGRLALLTLLPLIALPSAFVTYSPNIVVALCLLGSMSVVTPIVNVAMNASIQELVSNDSRGFAYSLLAVFSALPAGVGGPLVIAFVTQHVLHAPNQIGLAFLIVGLPVLLAASACFFVSWRQARRITHLSPHMRGPRPAASAPANSAVEQPRNVPHRERNK
jgi:MFS family permease